MKSAKRTFLLSLLLVVSAGLAFFAMLLPRLANVTTPAFKEGLVASQDILAPQAATYVSLILTEQKRDLAERSVAPIYTPPDTSIARQQLEGLRAALAYISAVRSDAYATNIQKLADLAALESIHLRQDIAATILGLTDARWQTVQQEAMVVLGQVMQNPIRPDRIEDTNKNVPNLVNFALPENQAEIVAELVVGFVAPNSFFNEGQTAEARRLARQAVPPVERSFILGETVLRRGQVITSSDFEALQQLGITQSQQEKWQEPASMAILVGLMAALLAFYFHRSQAATKELRALTLIATLFLVFLYSGRMIIPGHTVIPFAFPLAAYSLTVASLFGAELALISTLPLAILVAFGLENSLELTLFYTLSGLMGVFALGFARRIFSFVWAGVAVAISALLVVLVFRLPMPTTDWIGIATLTGASLLNGLAAAGLTILLQFLFALLMGLTTPMQLIELTRPDNPLLQMILRDAPGTYQHSLQVANLAEQAAERIGADTLLTRVGALYHDVGKSINPFFFIENQVPGFLNPHDDLEPEISAATIIRHVQDGIELARKYRLPRRIVEFIAEHHGTMITQYQYAMALAAAGGDASQVDIEKFHYPGPRPHSRETAIVMLADGSEARVRAERPKDENELRTLIKEVISQRVAGGQLDHTRLTLQDLDTIQESFTTTLRGIYHPRVVYPKLLEAGAGSAEPAEVVRDPKTTPIGRRPSDLPVNQPLDAPQIPE